tara:strand:- start:16 stop:180 length:165 start_codon:yes stop_codon:yes gene_type:complete
MTVEIRINDDDSLEVSGDFDLLDEEGDAYRHRGRFDCAGAAHPSRSHIVTPLMR